MMIKLVALTVACCILIAAACDCLHQALWGRWSR
jgi:hypothetical protein